MRRLTIEGIHQGPLGSANGGYVAGLLGDALRGAPSTVRIHRPVPVDTSVLVDRRGDTAFIRHGEEVVATAELTNETIPATAFVEPGDVLSGEAQQLELGMFSECFVCGQPAPEGLGVDLRALPDGRFAAVWRPADSSHIVGPLVDGIYLRSALDCPGGFAALSANQILAVTGTLTSRVEFLPEASSTLVVVGEATWSEGRKLGAVSTVFTGTGEVVASASAVWIALAPMMESMTAGRR